jgi:hypothetical protein
VTKTAETTETTKIAKKAALSGVSLDGWAVALALALAALVWGGWIKRIPW